MQIIFHDLQESFEVVQFLATPLLSNESLQFFVISVCIVVKCLMSECIVVKCLMSVCIVVKCLVEYSLV